MSEQIRKAIRQMSGVTDSANFLICNVDSVDVSKRTCNVTTLDEFTSEITGVQLMASIDDGFLLVPAVGSQVIISLANNKTPYVAMFSQLDKILAVVGDSGIEITATSIKLNDGSLGGLIKILELVSKLNNIENDLNDLKTVFSGWTPVSNDGGAALKTAAATWFAQQLTPTKKSDLENPNITHGESL